MAKQRKRRRRLNRFARALKITKGRSCDRKAVLRAVAAGASPKAATKRHCDD